MNVLYRRLLLGSAASVAFAGLPAQAQETSAQTVNDQQSALATVVQAEDEVDDDEADTANTVVVTGSRIRRPAAESISPVTSVGEDELDARGINDALDLIKELPALRGSESIENNQYSFGDQGVRRANLRGLGAFRSLTAIDNRRRGTTSAGFFGRQAFDWNTIPSRLIERIDVLTGGASSTYGSDAVTGVINITLKKKIDGIEAGGTVGAHDEYEYHNAYLSAGTKVGNGNLVVHGEYAWNSEFTNYDAERLGYNGYYPNRVPGLRQFIDRAPKLLDPNIDPSVTVPYFGVVDIWNGYYSNAIPSFTTITDGRGYAPIDRNGNVVRQANGTPDYARLVTGVPTYGGPSGTYLAGTANPTIYDRALGKFRAIDLGEPGLINFWGCSWRGGCEVRPSESSYWSPSTRYNLYTRLDQDLGSNITAEVEVNYAKSKSSATLVGYFINRSDNVRLNRRIDVVDLTRPLATNADRPTVVGQGDNILLSPALRQQLDELGQTGFQVNRELTELGPRSYSRDQDYWFASAGLEGKFGNGWVWEVHYDYSQADYAARTGIEPSRARFNNARDVVIDQATGRLVCRSSAARAQGCVPIDLLNGLSPQAVSYLQTSAQEIRFKNRSHYVMGNLSGDSRQLFQLPGGPVRFALGAEMRYDRQERDATEAFTANTGFFNSQLPPFGVDNTVYEGYVELYAPLLKDMPFVHRLDFEGGYRATKYRRGSGEVQHTWKAGVRYSPLAGAMLRGVWARAIRAPSPAELLLPGGVGFIGYTDPCGPTALAANPKRLEGCKAWLNYSEEELRNFSGLTSGLDLSSGNPDLRPEVSDTFTAGLVLEPKFASGLFITADYFHVRIDDLVAQLGESSILQRCADNYSPDSQYCRLIDRDPVTRQVTLVRDTFVNVNRQRLKGVDASLGYRFDLNALGRLVGARQADWGRLNLSLNGQYLLIDKFYNIDGSVTDYAGTYYNPDMRIRGSASYSYKKTRLFWSVNYSGRTDRDEEPRFRTPAISYHDASITQYIEASPGKWLSASFGVNNVFNTGPRLRTWTYGGAGVDRIQGRGFWASVSVPVK